MSATEDDMNALLANARAEIAAESGSAKRKRRTKAEMEAARTADAVDVVADDNEELDEVADPVKNIDELFRAPAATTVADARKAHREGHRQVKYVSLPDMPHAGRWLTLNVADTTVTLEEGVALEVPLDVADALTTYVSDLFTIEKL